VRTKGKVNKGVLQHMETNILARVCVIRARNTVKSQKFDLVTNKINKLVAQKLRAADTLCERALLKTFQNRRVSSPAPVTIASPSGDTACDK